MVSFRVPCSRPLTAVALATWACGRTDAPPRPPRSFAITHATVIDGSGAPPSTDVTVVVDAGRILDLGAAPAIPAGAEIVDGTGKFLVPGLWDMHVHTSWDRRFTMPLFVANGVTGVREMFAKDLGAVLRARREIAAGTLIGPRIVTAGRIIDGPNAGWPGSIVANTPAQGEQAVAETQSQGADFVKVYSSLSREVYFAIAEAARARRIPFAGHVPTAVTAAEASEAGQKSIEHLTGIPIGPDIELDSLFARFHRNGTWQTPTLTVLRVGANPGDPSLSTNPNLRYVPYALGGLWSLARRMAAGDTSQKRGDEKQGRFARQLEMVGRMYRDSVGLLAGSDEPNPYTIPGFSIHDELALLVRAGVPPMAALMAATRNPAIFLGAEDSLGTIGRGKTADLVLLDANPLENIANTRAITAVVLHGRLLRRPALDSILAGVERSRWRPGAAAVILSGAILHRVPNAVFVVALGLSLTLVAAPLLLRRRRRARRT